MRIVLDTNILLICVSSRSAHHWIWKELLAGNYQLIVTNEIISEYEEKIAEHMNTAVAEAVLTTLLESPFVSKQDPYYRWNLIKDDEDDNKFVDATVAGNAKYLVSHDRHFKVLAEIDFPKVEVITAEEFGQLLNIT